MDVNDRDGNFQGSPPRSPRERLLELQLRAARKQRNNGRTITPRARRSEPVTLSYSQERLWFLDQMGLVGAAYNVPLRLRLFGTLNERALERSFAEIVRRHEILRTRFAIHDGVPRQSVLPFERFALIQHDLCNISGADEREQQLQRLLDQELLHQFNLSTGPLIRVVLVRLARLEYALGITMHHIVSDGWSVGIMARELSQLYEAHTRGAAPLPPLPIQYADYSLWQREWLQGGALTEQLEYWKKKLEQAPPELHLPTDRPRPAVETFRGGLLTLNIPVALSEALERIAVAEGATLFMVCLAAYQVFLARWSGQQDVVVGTPTAGRRNQQAESLIGFFVNTLPLRTRIRGDLTFRQLLNDVKQTTLEAYAHQDLPFERLVSELQPERSLSHQPLFQVMLALQNYPEERLRLGDVTWTWTPVEYATAHFDLTLYLHRVCDGIRAEFEYAADLFDRSTVERMSASFCTLLESVVAGLDLSVDDLPILDQAARAQLLSTFNSTPQLEPAERCCVHQLFEKQARLTPANTAVAHEGRSLTYSELDAQANHLARRLRARGVAADTVVAVCAERGLPMIIGVLAILKAGGAYLPLDPSYPVDRISYMVNDARPRLIITERKLAATLPATERVLPVLDEYPTKLNAPQDDEPSSNNDSNPDSLLYLIYTSGSTGQPKGTAMPHDSMVNLLRWHRVSFEGRCKARVLQFAALSFDVAFQEMFSTLSSGGTLLLIDEWIRKDARALVEFISRHSIQRLFVPPLVLQAIAEYCCASGDLPQSLQDVITAGEQLRITPEVRQLFVGIPECRLHNHYGPTETHVVTAATLPADPTAWPILPPIGKPIANARIYVLDEKRRPVPLGVTGEVYIGGAVLARGYLNRAELTSQRFVEDPFSAGPGQRLYRTGDLGRWRPDGNLEYLGRNDTQVKVRGFRIELGEIEAQLAKHPQIVDAAVIVRQDTPGESRIVAYLTTGGASSAPSEELRVHLRAVLPEFMIPNAFVFLERLPLTPNGKLDRAALPAPTYQSAALGYERPRGELEQTLASIWQELLKSGPISRTDHFFQLGGHSLLIVKMMESMRRAGLQTDVRTVYSNPILVDLARALTNTSADRSPVPENLIPLDCVCIRPDMLPLVELTQREIDSIVAKVPGGAANVQDIYPLVALQEGMLFHHMLDEDSGDTYLLPMLLSFSTRQRLDDFINAMQRTINRHDVLRSSIVWEELTQPVQVVHRHAILPVEEVPVGPDNNARTQLQRLMAPELQRLPLQQAPLIRLRVASDPGDAQWYALLQLHHMTCDHESIEVLVREIKAHMEDRSREIPRAVQYRSHVAQALGRARTYDAQAFFTERLASINESTAPFGIQEVHGDAERVVRAARPVSPEVARRLRAQARKLGVSAATLFHAAWALVVAKTSGRDDIVFGTVLLGRLQGSTGAQHVMGIFINTLPLRLQLAGISAAELVDNTRTGLTQLLSYEQASLAAAQRCSGIPGTAPLFTALLNYRHSAVDIPALFSSAPGMTFEEIQSWTNYPLMLSVDDLGEDFALSADTERRIDPERLLSYVHAALESLVGALEQAAQTNALALSILPADERAHVISTCNHTQVWDASHGLVHQLFEDQVEKSPDSIAVVHHEQQLTYRQLNSHANRLARYLVNQGAGPDQTIGICLARGPQMLIGLLAIMKAGCAYLPLDPNYPPERLHHMLTDAAPRLIITQTDLRRFLPDTPVEAVCLDTELKQIGAHVSDNLSPAHLGLDSSHLIYVIYTSGSTGRPRGVQMPHRAMINLLEWHRRDFSLRGSSRVLQFAALSFDVAFQECFSTLSGGGTLVLLDEWTRKDPQALARLLTDYALDRVFLPPLVLQALAEVCTDSGPLPVTLRDIAVAGEQLRITPEIVALFRLLRDCKLHNHYGPTESHVVTTLTLSGPPEDWPLLPPIGKPISNTSLYVLDARHEPVPIGVAGELYISGNAVARGYHQRLDLTKQRFINDPFATDENARMYKTGDLARRQPDGTLEYLGRDDDQVKIRGYRIELGEIESRLEEHVNLKKAAALVREDVPGDKHLIAYCVPQEGTSPQAEELREYLRARLPEYMIPSGFVLLPRLPVTPSGKLDRRSLPVPEAHSFGARNYEAPRGELETALAEVLREVLQIQRIGRTDSFFELGGHSLLVLKAILRINRRFDATLKVSDLYKSPRLADLALHVSMGTSRDHLIDLTKEAVLSADIMPARAASQHARRGILLTGGCGFVGRFLLNELLQSRDAKLYCLIRANSEQQAHSRLRTTLIHWDLWRDDFAERIVAIPGDLCAPNLGVHPSTYDMLCERVDTVFHSATSMNHLETYSMAKAANVNGTQEILKLATRRATKLVNYISTSGIFGAAADGQQRRVNENTDIDHERHWESQGYTASKWVGEKLCLLAQQRGVPCNILRLGLVWADTRKGRYDEAQHYYRVVKSCLLSGYAIKNYRHHMPPTPVDYVAAALLSLSAQRPAGGGIFHISSPTQMGGGVFEACNELLGTSLELLSFPDWVSIMKSLSAAGRTLPVVPLLEFYENHESWESQPVALDCSLTYQELERDGITAPTLNNELLTRFLEDMFRRDRELRENQHLRAVRVTGT